MPDSENRTGRKACPVTGPGNHRRRFTVRATASELISRIDSRAMAARPVPARPAERAPAQPGRPPVCRAVWGRLTCASATGTRTGPSRARPGRPWSSLSATNPTRGTTRSTGRRGTSARCSGPRSRGCWRDGDGRCGRVAGRRHSSGWRYTRTRPRAGLVMHPDAAAFLATIRAARGDEPRGWCSPTGLRSGATPGARASATPGILPWMTPDATDPIPRLLGTRPRPLFVRNRT